MQSHSYIVKDNALLLSSPEIRANFNSKFLKKKINVFPRIAHTHILNRLTKQIHGGSG